MSNFLDQDEDEIFRDQPDEVSGQDSAHFSGQSQEHFYAPPAVRRSSGRPVATEESEEKVEEEISEEIEEEEEDTSAILNDARLRLEQGRLYEMIMKHSLFADVDADGRAIRNVEREIKKFAQQRMEIMLGMRQETARPEGQGVLTEAFPFNSLEVETLKALSAAATKGASRDAEPFEMVEKPKRQTLSTISSPKPKPQPKSQPKQTPKPLTSKPATPVKRARVSADVQRILEEEGVTMDEINEVFDPNHKPLDAKAFSELSAEEIAERNRRIGKRVGRTAVNPNALPPPPPEQLEAIYTTRANQATANPQMQAIMNLLTKKK